MAEVKEKIGCAIAGLLMPIMWILGMVIHIWTIIIAYAFGGLLAAIITLVVPVFAQIYWMIRTWVYVGTFFNLYCLAIAAYAIGFIAIIGLLAFFDRSSY